MNFSWRINLLLIFFVIFTGLIISRLFYWQIIKGEELKALAEKQHWVSFEIPAKRGEIFFNDGFPLVSNEEAYLVFGSPKELKEEPEKVAKRIAPILSEETSEKIEDLEKIIIERLSLKKLWWTPLKQKVSRQTKEKIEKMSIKGIGFEEQQKRVYPEASMAAHLLGFVGFDKDGKEKGYFGLEGFYDLQLKGKPGIIRQEKDALGNPILLGEDKSQEKIDGRSLVLNLDRSVQYIVEEKLKKGLIRYGAKSGTVTVMDPFNGAIIAMASFPNYHPGYYWQYKEEIFSNPVIASSYEPGSTFKVIIMAAALDSGVVTPESRCEKCNGPRKIAEYTIKTWNDKYYPNSTMTEIIQHSDNVGMVFVAEKLGIERTYQYLKKFGFGKPTGIDLQEETSPPLREKKDWKFIDLATISFGQGIAVTPLQMVKAVGALANGGVLYKPFVVKKIIGEKGEEEIQPKKEERVIKPNTAQMIKEMMVNAVEKGEAKWAKPQGFRIAGKTGTAQIPVAGHYDEEKTIASFIGFAPADKPKFVMLVTLREPTSSPWGSETAAPLWFEIANELFLYYGILVEEK
ncbi:MAG: peptidoglycan D,D-transpeptidase FtsI family protein [Microgenomates group bacterium]